MQSCEFAPELCVGLWRGGLEIQPFNREPADVLRCALSDDIWDADGRSGRQRAETVRLCGQQIRIFRICKLQEQTCVAELQAVGTAGVSAGQRQNVFAGARIQLGENRG